MKFRRHKGLVVAEHNIRPGFITVELRGPDGELKYYEELHNLITDAGDLYYATRSIAAVAPVAPADATKVTGMKLGTGSTAVAKNGAGAALVTYVTGITANKGFDTSFPQTANLGAGLGVNDVYKTTWNAGEATNSALREVVIVNDSGTDATSSAANTISRGVFASAIDKQSGDTLAVTWNHKNLGA